MTRLVAAVAICVCSLGCRTAPGMLEFSEDADVRILFIGNSLTYVNNVPGMVQTLARRDGRLIDVGVIAGPDLNLEDHCKRVEGDHIRRLRPEIVVLQQGPSSLSESREHLALWAARFAAVIREAGGEPALYMVWPDESRPFAFPAVEQSYAEAAAAARGRLLPVGTTWLEIREQDERLDLYGPDGFHPARLGSIAAAYTIYAALFDVSAAELPAEPTLAAETMAVLRRAVAASLERWAEVRSTEGAAPQ